MVFDILTIFPKLLESYLKDSIIWRELKKGTIQVRFHDIRKFSKDKHKKVDDRPYGGGAGMLMSPQPLYDCIAAVKKKNPGAKVMYLSPHGKIFDYALAKKLSKRKGLILLCGRYEGIDERIRELCVDEEISMGNFVLTGGELPAMVIVDVVTRLLPNALGNKESAREDSFTKALSGKKEYPHYTRPPVFKKRAVPKVLLSGDHAKIAAWRKKHLQ